MRVHTAHINVIEIHIINRDVTFVVIIIIQKKLNNSGLPTATITDNRIFLILEKFIAKIMNDFFILSITK